METLKIRITSGCLLHLPKDLGKLTPYVLLEQEDWFEDEIKFLRKIIKRGQSVLDIGANYGCYTTSLAYLVGPSGSVTAVEPDSNTIQFLEMSVRELSDIKIDVIHAALGAKDGIARLSQSSNSELNALTEKDDASSENVEIFRLDTLARAKPELKSLDFIKLDAEGSELAILDGGSTVFELQSPIVMFERMHGASVNTSLVNAFKERNYNLFVLAPGLNILIPYDPLRADGFNLNLFALKLDRIVEAAKDGWLLEKTPMAKMPKDLASPFLKNGNPAERYAQMRAVETLKVKTKDLAGLFLIGRAARAIGRRGAAVNILLHALKTVQNGGVVSDGVIVSPDPLFDNGTSPCAGIEWSMGAAVTAYERVRSFSSYFAQPETLPLLEWLSTTPFHKPEMERRRQLMQLRMGQRGQLANHPVFKNGSADHLNHHLWIGDNTT